MADSEAKALKTFQEAEKKCKGGGGGFMGGLFGGGGSKTDEACELFVRSANLYKIAKKWNEAGGAFVRAAELQLARGEAKHDAASNYADAANCFRKTNAQHAVDCLLKAADIYTDMGRFTMAAKYHTQIAELYETDSSDIQQAMLHYEKAADYYKGEEQKSSANKCFLKVAEYAAQTEQYQKAIDIYEEVGASAAENNLLKYTAKDYFFRALICHLCIDLLNAQHAIKRYEDAHPAFSDTRELKLIKDLILALEEQNADLFTDTVKAYDKMSRLDQWHTSLLVKIKRTCRETETLGGGGGDGGDDDDGDDLK